VPSAIAVKGTAGEAGRGLAGGPSCGSGRPIGAFPALSVLLQPGNSAQFGQAGWSRQGPREPGLSDFAPPLSFNVARLTEAQKGRGGAVHFNLAILP
jgi:hypothetical protein